MKRTRLCLVGFGLLALAGCGGILPKPASPPALYRLTAATDQPPSPVTAPVQLLVGMPEAEAGLDTTRIALARSATTLDYFADAAWTDRLPTLLQSRLVATFEAAHRLAAVGPEPSDLHGDDLLILEVRHFEAVYGAGAAPLWHIEISAKLVALPDRKLVDGRVFQADLAVPRNDMAAIVETADADWRGVARQIADWAADALAHPAH
jgi:cholesterol transport system auxiliary component